MSGHEKDPLWRFLAGCAVVVAALAALVVGGALLIGWRLARDEAPGRPRETFLVVDEARYWCLDLKQGDTGLAGLFARFDEINDATRRDLLRGTFLQNLPFPRRRARLDELAPFTLELSLSTSDKALGLPVPTGWAARGTFSHGLFRMRLALKLMRLFASRDTTNLETIDIDGIAVTEVHGKNVAFAVATLGDRVLVANDASRLRTVLRTAAATPLPELAELLALHDSIKLDGEDAWAFYSNRRVGDLSKPVGASGALASFDVNDRDELAFRVVVRRGAVEEASDFAGTPADCSAVVSRFLPGVPSSAFAIDGNGAHRSDEEAVGCSGRIVGVSKRLTELAGRVRDLRLLEPPFATPTPPSPPQPDDPRNGTPAGPTREGTATPPH